MYWLEVSVVTDGEAAEAVAETLARYSGGRGVAIVQLGDPESLDPYALEPEATVKIFLPEDEDLPETRQRISEAIYYLGRLYPVPPPEFREIKDEDWAHAWKAHYKPFRVGRRLWIQPSWDTSQLSQSDDIVLTLDPGMAFGTGLHPTTQMCLQAVESLVQPGMTVLDVGTGSGILAIAAGKLGAAGVLAIDNDPQAVSAAEANIAMNELAGRVSARLGVLDDLTAGHYDLVLVNILAPVIIGLLQHGRLLEYIAPEGRLILSGIIDTQQPDVESALRESGGFVETNLTVRDWITLICRR